MKGGSSMSNEQALMPEAFEPGKAPVAMGGAGSDRFVAAMLDLSPTENKRRSPGRLAVSILVHFLLISAVIIGPIYFADNSLDLKAMTTTFLVAPRPPAPPPPPAAIVKVAQVAPKTFQPTPLTAPKAIPKAVAVVSDEPPPSVGGGSIGGVAGGVEGGVFGGMLNTSAAPPPPPPVATKQQVVRVGGDVQAPRLLSRVQPVYPAVARTARIEGDVVVDAIIDEHGNVVKAHVVSGPGLLVPAALAAVQQWKYAPTYLNGVAVPIGMNVVVQFHLHSQES
jgi:periplasmic protein TonB